MNRRQFIASAAGLFTISAAGRAFGDAVASNRVRLAIVGCRRGGRGFTVMNAALKVPGVEIAVVCDVDSRAREAAAAQVEKVGGNRPVQEKDFRKVIERKDIDGIISETPDHFHAYSAIMAMRAGKHVYVEKPCCLTPAEGLMLLKTAKETGMVVQVGSQRRASLSYAQAIDFVRESGAIGELKWGKCWYMANRKSIGHGKKTAVPDWLDWDLWQGPAPREDFRDNIVHYNWHWFRKWGTAEMGNNAPHFADAARWALGCDTFPSEVQCMAMKLFDRDDDYEFSDTFNASFRYPNGKFLTFELTSHCNERPNQELGTGALVYGEKGTLLLRPNDTAAVYDEKSQVIREWLAGGIVMDQKTISTSDPTAGLDVEHMTDFVEAIRAKRPTTRANADVGVKSSLLPILANLAGDCRETLRIDPATGRLLSKAGESGWTREYAKGWELALR